MTPRWFAVPLIAVMLASAGIIARQAPSADARYAVTGMVLAVDAAGRTFAVSIDRIPGFMEAMTMTFGVKGASELAGLRPGDSVEFALVVAREGSHAEGIRIRRHQNLEQDPLTARRLALLTEMAGRRPKALSVGEVVPDVRLIDQAARTVALSSFRGKVVAMNFMYTTCQLPDFCLRIVNHFGVVQKRLADAMGRDLVLLTVTFDPLRDTPEVLAEYARQWQPVSSAWRFLTGAPADVRRALDLFGVSAFANDGLMDHSLHTVIIDRAGRLAVNIEGNHYSSDQLVELVRASLTR